VQVPKEAVQIQDKVTHQLAGTMESNVTSTIYAVKFDAEGSEGILLEK